MHVVFERFRPFAGSCQDSIFSTFRNRLLRHLSVDNHLRLRLQRMLPWLIHASRPSDIMVYHPQASLSPVVAYIEIAFDSGKSDIAEKVHHGTMACIHLFKVRLGSVRLGSIRPMRRLYFMISSPLKNRISNSYHRNTNHLSGHYLVKS